MLDRSEAVMVLQDMLASFSGRSISAFWLSKSDRNGKSETNYRFCIKGEFTDACKQEMRQIARYYYVSVHEEDGLLVCKSLL